MRQSSFRRTGRGVLMPLYDGTSGSVGSDRLDGRGLCWLHRSWPHVVTCSDRFKG